VPVKSEWKIIALNAENETNKKALVYNIHLSAASTNSLRLKQLKTTFAEIENDYHEPIILLGDFNYAFGRSKLEELTQEFGFEEATDQIDFTMDGRLTHYTFAEKFIFKIYQKLYQKTTKNDYVFYKNCKHIDTKKIDIRLSDHYPLLAEFEI
jgi:endonuclease/exonuclease/phosphatase (EEP) superfamily protein YafD